MPSAPAALPLLQFLAAEIPPKAACFWWILNTQNNFRRVPRRRRSGPALESDGSKAYAMTRDGMAYIYEPPLI